MCGRYYVSGTLVGETDKTDEQGYEVHPTDVAPVIMGDHGRLVVSRQRWGYPGFEGTRVIFNARAESVMEKRLFSNGIWHHRIAIPGNWFYEWNRNKERVTFFREDSTVLYMAGFYDWFEGEERFVILTTAANESMSGTHDRMPLILEEGEIRDWIFCQDRAQEMLRRVPISLAKRMEYEQKSLSFFSDIKVT